MQWYAQVGMREEEEQRAEEAQPEEIQEEA